MIGLIDSQISNIGSIANMLRYLDIEFTTVSKPEELCACDKFILPGVGAFDSVVRSLSKDALDLAIAEEVLNKGKFYLGICVGAQILCRGSDEGELPGFGWLDQQVTKFDPQQVNRVPHMGWNTLKLSGSALLRGTDEEFARFYFLHSYFIPMSSEHTIAECEYGLRFSAAVQKQNIFGVQFHPEKSHKYGMRVFQNFGAL